MSDDDDDGGYMESRERRTKTPVALPVSPEGDLAEHLTVARCPACRHVLVPRVRAGRAGFSCGCALGV